MNQDHTSKPLWRLAARIHAAATSTPRSYVNARLPADAWEECRQLARRITLAQSRGWYLAAERLRQALSERLSLLETRLRQEHERIRPVAAPPLASAQEIYRDLRGLFEEFENVSWDFQEKTLAVTTEPIVLEDIALGRFQIQLRWDQLERSHCYEAIALEPNPPSFDDSITHPHVQEGSVCEGQGRAAIRQALLEGRLLDFFLMIRSLLRTYNARGAYAQLDRWSGVSCRECGELCDAEQMTSCTTCGRESCERCCESCSGCRDQLCSRCAEPCASCSEVGCRECLTRCRRCDALVCSDCHEEEFCETCCEASQEATT